MTLKEYLRKYNLSKAEVARRCGMHYSTFFYVCEGYGVSYKNMEKILRECDGVTFKDLMPTKIGKTNKRSLQRKITVKTISPHHKDDAHCNSEKPENRISF